MRSTLALLRDLAARGERVHGDPAGPAADRLADALALTERLGEPFCRLCGGPWHASTGAEYAPTFRACGPCERAFWGWVRGRLHWLAAMGDRRTSVKPRRAARA